MRSSELYIAGENLTSTELLAELDHCTKSGAVVGLDTETTGINPKKQSPAGTPEARISCWSLSTPKYPRVFLWAKHLHAVKSALRELPVCGHNIWGFDYHMLMNHGIELGNIVGDTLVMSRLIYCSKDRNHGLKSLSKHWLGFEQPPFDSLFRRPEHKVEFVQESRKVKGEVINLEYRESKRKVGEHKGVPTLFATGERGMFGKRLEFIPLDQIPEQYPNRLQSLYDYATYDALITRELYLQFSDKLAETACRVRK